jgi:hypothetical protein
MRTPLLSPVFLFSVLLILPAWNPHSAYGQEKTATPSPPVDKKTVKEVLLMEEKFALALAKKDGDSLEKLLSENYTDGYDGADRALNKQGAISIAKGSGLSLYKIEKDEHLSRKGDNVLVEGLVRDKRDLITDVETEIHWGRVQRLWTHKDGRWQLLRQLRPAIRDEDSKPK